MIKLVGRSFVILIECGIAIKLFGIAIKLFKLK